MSYDLTFISQENFEKHVLETIKSYGDSLKSINLQTFNKNTVDPIKLLFDKEIFKKTFEEVILDELQRQRDKHNTNAIGYFHQNIFKYIEYCEVPNMGWDVIVRRNKKSPIYVEMKNKHNTMNSSSAQKTYIKMQNKLLKTPNCKCYLVEAIAPKSRDATWTCSIDGTSVSNKNIRRVSMDNFYKEVTGEADAFYKMCVQLPKTIKKLLSENPVLAVEKDTVIKELQQINSDFLVSLYLLAFETYEGFSGLKS